MRRSKVNNVEYGFLLWVGSFLIAIVMGVWLGTLLMALQAPEVYGVLFSSASTVLASIVASASIVFGVYKYKQEREFTLAMQLPFPQELLQKQKEFYEQYVEQIDALKLILRRDYVNVSPNDIEAKKISVCNLREKYEKWCSRKQIDKILEIEKSYFDLAAQQYLVMSRGSRKDIDQQAYMDTLLDGEFDVWKNELKEVFFVDTIVEKQARILSGKT